MAPSKCSNIKEIPYLTVGSDIGSRSYIYENKEEGIIVEDIKDESNIVYR